MNYLLDTNVLSEVTKRRPNANVAAWFDSVSPTDLHIGVITLGEIRKSIELKRRVSAERAAFFETWLATLLLQYRSRIVVQDEAVADRWGRLMAADRNLPVEDGQLAAMALEHGMTLVTRSTRHLAATGALLHDPF